MAVRAGDQGVDCSYAKPPAARLVELGYTFLVGYISVPPSSPDKNITKAQYDEYEAAGLDPYLVWEMTQTRASLGAAAGAQDGRDAKRLAGERGYPIGKAILVADDTNTAPGNIDAQEAYMRAFAGECKPYPIGIYGDVDILERCVGLWVLGWVPNAWAWSGVSRADAEARATAVGAHVLQHKGFYIDNVWAVDPNVAIADFPAWSTAESIPPVSTPAPVSKESDVFEGFVKDDSPAGKFWARGVDEHGQWACYIEELGVAWELYRVNLTTVVESQLLSRHRVPAFTPTISIPPAPPAVAVVDTDALAEAVANKLAARLSS